VDEVLIFEESTPECLIKHIKPDVLVKGGDWGINEIIGADFVKSYGGQVHSLPLKSGYSSSSIVNKIRDETKHEQKNANSLVTDSLSQHIDVMNSVLSSQQDIVFQCGEIIWNTFKNGGKVLIAGNGGSAADAQHIAAEFVGRYETERKAFPAISLSTDTSALTALANDYGFENIFERQVEALANAGDCLIAISTSGTSANVIAAVMMARSKGCRVIGMTGAKGTKLAGLSDACFIVPSERTARIQEAHITVAHIWCEMVDSAVLNGHVSQ